MPPEIRVALSTLNLNHITEIRLRLGLPVMVEYFGDYRYLTSFGVSEKPKGAIIAHDLNTVINTATDGCIYKYAEQIKNGFITVENGVRIGLAGEYVTQNGEIQTVKGITSLNIRIPHEVVGCSQYIFDNLLKESLHNIIIFSRPGFGKTTMLRDIAVKIGCKYKCNILIFDERNEIAAINGDGNGFVLGDTVDVVRCGDKNSAISSAIRAMKPGLIITDELYGEADLKAVSYAVDCGISVIASSHITERKILKRMPFEYYVELIGIGARPVIYDKNFIAHSCNRADNLNRSISLG